MILSFPSKMNQREAKTTEYLKVNGERALRTNIRHVVTTFWVPC